MYLSLTFIHSEFTPEMLFSFALKLGDNKAMRTRTERIGSLISI